MDHKKIQQINRTNGHLENCVRQIRENLVDNKPVKALFCLEMLERELYGTDKEPKLTEYTDGTPSREWEQ